ncbi:hypothetical protein BH23BAC1_BH23BAC1_27850 [soil metagenome]
MYNFFLILHSWNRWLVLIFAIIAIYRAVSGWQGDKNFSKQDSMVGGIFIGVLHLQVLIGLILYFILSPITQAAFEDFGAAMRNAEMRFWAVEHSTGMIIAAVIAQIGRILSKKAPSGRLKHKRAFIYYTIAFVLILITMPYLIRPFFRI